MGAVSGSVSSARPGWRRAVAAPEAATAAFGLAVAVGVCWPLLGSRPVFLLDWVIGPHPPLVTSSMLGLHGGLTTGTPVGLATSLAVHVLGEAVTWLVLFACFPVAAVAAGRLTGGRRRAQVTAAAVYCVNPWVLDRAYAGQLTLLFGYALLPLATRSALRAAGQIVAGGRQPPRQALEAVAGPALWWGVLSALSPHYAWIYGLVLVAVVLVHLPRLGQPGRLAQVGRLVGWLAAATTAFGLLSLYIVVAHAASGRPAGAGAGSLALYRTSADPHLGLLANVAALYGFWRQGPHPVLVKTLVSGWPLLALALVVLAAAGLVPALRRHADTAGSAGRRRLAWLLAVVAAAGLLLALGTQGPTGPLFRLAYHHVPFFAVMREPQKFLMLVALAYAVGTGWAVDRLTARTASTAGQLAVAGLLGVALPLSTAFTIFDGFDATVAPSTLPAAYPQADALMGVGAGKILYLPWHLYEQQPFTGGRDVANPGPSLFRRPVLSGDNVQAGGINTQSTSPRAAFVARLVAGPRPANVGAALAPLGVKYVVLAHCADWRLYGWLNHQPDLHPVLADPALQVWQNTAYHGAGQRPGPAPHTTVAVRQLSPVAYQVPAGRPGLVAIDAAYQPGWVFDGRPGRPGAGGTVVFRAGAAGGVATFTPWGITRLGYVLSGAMALALVIGLWWSRRRPRTAGRVGEHRRRQPAPTPDRPKPVATLGTPGAGPSRP